MYIYISKLIDFSNNLYTYFKYYYNICSLNWISLIKFSLTPNNRSITAVQYWFDLFTILNVVRTSSNLNIIYHFNILNNLKCLIIPSLYGFLLLKGLLRYCFLIPYLSQVLLTRLLSFHSSFLYKIEGIYQEKSFFHKCQNLSLGFWLVYILRPFI